MPSEHTWQVPDIGEPWPWGTKRCCEEDWGGSHWHCGHCGKVSSSQGHWVKLVTGNWAKEACERWGLPFPFEGMRCDPSTNALADPPLAEPTKET